MFTLKPRSFDAQENWSGHSNLRAAYSLLPISLNGGLTSAVSKLRK
jgi:hypothetical protein